MNGKYVVVGGCGFIGHRVCLELQAMGHEVYIVDTGTNYDLYDRERHQLNLNARRQILGDPAVFHLDIRDTGGITRLLKDLRPDVVVHLANVPIATVALQRPVFASDQISGGTLNLLDAARTAGVERFVYISSSMVYGHFQTDPVDEEQPCRPREIYGALKYNCERLVRLYTDLYGMVHTIVRPTAVYGPTGNEAFVLTRFVRAACQGGQLGVRGEDTRLDFTFVHDTGRGVALAAASPRAVNETFNIACGGARTLLDAARYLQRLSPEAQIVVEPPDAIYPKRGTLSIDKARRLLGFESSYTLEEGLDVFYRYVNEHGCVGQREFVAA